MEKKKKREKEGKNLFFSPSSPLLSFQTWKGQKALPLAQLKLFEGLRVSDMPIIPPRPYPPGDP